MSAGGDCPKCGKPKYKTYGYCEEHQKEYQKKKNKTNNEYNRKLYKKRDPIIVPDRYQKEDFWDINGTAIFC